MADAVVVILCDHSGRLLLQYRDPNARKNPNQWGFFGGAIQFGESPVDAARREISEELNYHLQYPELIATRTIPADGVKYYFREEYDSAQPLQLLEGGGMQWIEPQNAQLLQLVPHHRAILAHMVNGKKKNPPKTFGGY